MSPAQLENGEIGGVICPSFEVTARVIHERRERCLRELGAINASTTTEACQAAAECFGNAPGDIPFSLIYLAEGGEHNKQVRGLHWVI